MGARDVAVVLVGSVTLAACTTTHTLGSLDDPAERARVEDIIAHKTTYAEVTPVLSQYQDRPRVVGVTAAGLRLEPYPRATPVVVPGARLQYLVTFDRLRGARDGALAVGIPAFVAGAVAGLLLFEVLRSSCIDGCPPSDRSDAPKVALVVGGIAGLFGAAVGAGLGAAAGHEDRYVAGAAP